MSGPSTNLNYFDTATLVGVVPNLKKAQSFLLDKFFPNIVTSDNEFVAIDVDVGKRRMSPFVSPLVEGKLVEQRSVQTNIFKPAYIKDKRAPDLRKPIRRMIGERIGGAEDARVRMLANIQFEMEDQVDMITRRMEWMAAQALTTGQVTITGEGFADAVVNFGRNSALSVALSGSSQWGQANVIPTQMIEQWGHLVLRESGGVCQDIVFTTTPWNLFIQDPVVKNAIWYPGQAAGNSIQIGAEIQRGAQYKGNWGQYRLWVYNDWYVDPVTDLEVPMIADGTVLMTGPDMMGTRAFGAIMDPAFNYGAMAFAPKTWYQEDPAQTIIMMQSAPIVIPSRVNACLAATVCAPVVS